MSWPTVALRRVARFAYGDSLADADRNEGDVPVYGSNGPVGSHNRPNTLAPAIVIGRKGSFGKLQFSSQPVFAIDTTFYVDATLTDADIRWLYYVLQTLHLDELSEDVGVPGLSRERAYEQRLPLPPLEGQQAIAHYLDRETARIDALIAARREQLILVQERLGALLQHAIDDARPTLLPLRRVVRQFVDYRGATPEKSTAGVPLVTATNISNGRIDFSLGEQFVTEETYEAWMRRGFPEEGDVLLTTEAPLGEVAAIADARVALAQRLILLKPDLIRLSKPYLRLAVMSPRTRADLLSRASGSTVWGIRADRLRDVLVPVPHFEAQRHIVARMAAAESIRASAETHLGHQVKLLTERRQALIIAAVTGELPVTVAA